MHRIYVSDDSVPLEEHLQIVRLLQDNEVEYVERPRLIGTLFRFGSRGPGSDFMVESESERDRARALIDQHQSEMTARSRADYEANRSSNRLREIVGWIISALVIGGVLWLSLKIGF